MSIHQEVKILRTELRKAQAAITRLAVRGVEVGNPELDTHIKNAAIYRRLLNIAMAVANGESL